MTDQNARRATDTSLTRDLLDAARYYLGGRRGPYILAGIAAVASLAFNWDWLVAAGITPVLLAALPCAAMCALGLCVHRIGGRSCAQRDTAVERSPDDAATAPPTIDLHPVAPAIAATDTVPTVNPSTDPQLHPVEERRTVDA